jgi:thymidine kinase
MKKQTKGKLEVICGSMFSGKTEELIRRIRRMEYAHQKVIVFKHKVDDRMSTEFVHAHNGEKYKAIALENPDDMQLFITDETTIIGIDEVQFFSRAIIPTIFNLLEQGKNVIAAGLDLDFRGMPFGVIPTLMAVADSVTKLNAVCISCGKDACYSQRLINGKPARFDDPVVLVGAQDHYQARCRDCFIIDKKSWEETVLG